jgi:colanic acid biosynthesis glycosyl transferase WcaI
MKILLVNQCFYPDVVSTAQHLTDLAVELSKRGHDVRVISSSRGYDDPDQRFAKHEVWNGINIHRVSGSGFGKRSRWRRAADFSTFLLSCALRMLFTRRIDLVVVLTSPPMISFLVAILARLKRWRFVFWVMDMNPDEAIAAGWLRERSVTSKMLQAMSRHSLNRAQKVIALDGFMGQRIRGKGIAADKIVVIPPWAHDEIRYDQHGRETFRAAHGLSEKFVVMYSGNHSPCHPLNTLLAAARELAEQKQVVFCFAGGGSELEKVSDFASQHHLSNIVTLPYQPMSALAGSLSAADLHVVVMGDPFVGIIHPCKIYNILSVAAPVLYIGPLESHITQVISQIKNDACIAAHGDVETVVRYINERASSATVESETRSPNTTALAFSRQLVMPRFIEALHSICPSGAPYDLVVGDAEAQLASASRSTGKS